MVEMKTYKCVEDILFKLMERDLLVSYRIKTIDRKSGVLSTQNLPHYELCIQM